MTCRIVILTVTRIMRPIAHESVRHALRNGQALGLNLIVTDTHPIKATNLALNITKTYEIVSKNSKTGKMIVVVTNIRFLGENEAIHRTLVSEKC
jgi:hypothetical protein